MIEELINKIKNQRKCPKCGGSYVISTCSSCFFKNQELENDIKKLENALASSNLAKKQNFTELIEPYQSLMCIKSLNIPIVDRVLQNSNYLSFYNEYINNLNNKIENNKELNLKDYEFFKWYLDDKLSIDEKENFRLISLLIKAYFERKVTFSDEEKLKYIVMFVENTLKIQTNRDYKCHIDDKSDERNASINRIGDVIIYQNCLNDFNNYDAFSFFTTLFHECIHAVQFYLWNSNQVSFNSLFQIKDYLLDIIPNYYQDNYQFLLTEVEAFLNEGIIALDYMQRFKYQITKDMIEKKEKNEEIFNKNQNQFMRKVNGEYDDLFHLFDKYVKDFPKWLIKFPMLNIEYIVEDNKVRRKKLSELQEDYASKKYFKGANDEQIEYCYKYLLEEAKKIDENLDFNIKH